MTWWKRSSQPAADGPAAAELPLIRLEGIGRVFEGDAEEPAVALRDVTVDIDRGEFISVSGPSGCGKSTFLSIIAMLDTPTTGRYWLSGRPVDKLSPNERARVRNVDRVRERRVSADAT
jgi:putative ABC transport system ATP-binding protein